MYYQGFYAASRWKVLISSAPSISSEILVVPYRLLLSTLGTQDSGGVQFIYVHNHGLRTPNERINQRNLKFWADVADKKCFGRT